jgi:hypothetical protein
MTRRIRHALALCLLGASLSVLLDVASGRTATALAARERLVFIGVPTEEDCGCGPYYLGDFDLETRAGDPRGVLNLFGIPTSPIDVPDDQAIGIVTFVAALDDGAIVAQGQFPLDDGPTIVAIVGGTGRYRRARGYARIVPRGQGEIRVVLHVLS